MHALLAALLLAASPAAPPATLDVLNYRVIGAHASAGQPSAAALDGLGAAGFRTVVNLRTAGEEGAVEDEEARVTAQGLRYASIPVSPGTFTAEDADRVRAILDDPGAGPVLLHCASGSRVAGVLAVIAAQRGATREDALAEGIAGGLRPGAMTKATERVLAGLGEK